jgi:hypothetical protein
MNHRERLQFVLEHRVPDRVPIDFGAGGQTGVMASTIYLLKKYLGLLEPGERIKIIEPYQMLGEVDQKLQDYFGFDVVGIHPLDNMFGFKNEDYKEWTLFDGTPVLVPGEFNTIPDENGAIPMYAQGDKNYPPSCIMPRNGYYFDSIVRQNTVDESKLNYLDNCEEFTVLDNEQILYLKKNVEDAYFNTDKGIYLTFPGAGFGDVALVSGPFLKEPKGIRDVSEWYMSIALRPDYIKKVFDYQSDVALKNLELIYDAVGNKVQVIFMSGTDFGTQNAALISDVTYRDIYFPYQKKLNDWIHKNTKWKTFIHTCGAIDTLIPSIIEAGFDVLNPVQCSAVGMEPEKLKEKYGHKVVFWGGGVDTQKTLPFGTPEQVREEVSMRVKIFKEDSGFVFNAIHNVQSGIPVENFMAMLEAYKENCEY